MTGSLQFDGIGTQWHVSTNTSLPLSIQEKIQKLVDNFDRSYSRFRDDSLMTKIATQAGEYALPENARPLFSLYEKLYRLTDGMVTPLVGQLLSDAGYDSRYSLKPKVLSFVPKWEETMTYTFPNLTVKKPVLLDFGAAGKGYLIDLVGQLLRKEGILSFCINAGGDILYQNKEGKKIRVGLEHPDDTAKVIGVVELENGSICGSAGNRRKWGAFHHIMHPQKKTSASHILATWVIAESGLVADGLATALFFVDPVVLVKEFTFEYVILNQDYSLETSENFPAELFI